MFYKNSNLRTFKLFMESNRLEKMPSGALDVVSNHIFVGLVSHHRQPRSGKGRHFRSPRVRVQGGLTVHQYASHVLSGAQYSPPFLVAVSAGQRAIVCGGGSIHLLWIHLRLSK